MKKKECLMSELKAIIEALLLAAPQPMTLNEIGRIFEELAEDGIVPVKKEIKIALAAIEEDLQSDHRGIELVEVNGGYQLRTKPTMSRWVNKLLSAKPTRLSRPAIETLAIVAYRQPLTRADIEAIRSVDSGGVLKSLLERRLTKIVGRKEEPGRPLLYGTTETFLELFGLNDLKELPPLQELEKKAAEIMNHHGEEAKQELLAGLEELAMDPSELEWLDEQEKEAFEELDLKLAVLKQHDKEALETINPKKDKEPQSESAEDLIKINSQ
jgi:segregation and condensation protein B